MFTSSGCAEMATGTTSNAPNAKSQLPPAGAATQYSDYIETRVEKASTYVRLVDIAVTLMTVVAAVLVYAFFLAVVDQWFVRGGLSQGARIAVWILMVVGLLGYALWMIVPYFLRRINPLYAAKTIEETDPSLRNSIRDWLLLKRDHRGVPEGMYRGLEHQTAIGLSKVPVETVVDRSRLIRIGYFLVGVMVLVAIYAVASPKNLFPSMGRVLVPLADIDPVTRVQISEIDPGDTEAVLQQYQKVAATVTGLDDDEPVTLFYSTTDKQIVERPLKMQRSGDGNRFVTRLPDEAGGLSQDITYRIEAGDCISQAFKIHVIVSPSIVPRSVRYVYPRYTGRDPETVEDLGDIRALEGTKVVVSAQGSEAMASARIELDGLRGVKQEMELRQPEKVAATARFTLSMKRAGNEKLPIYDSYRLHMRTDTDRRNHDPIRYRVEILPDDAPVVEILQPTNRSVDCPLDGSVLIECRGRDPDYQLAELRLVMIDINGREIVSHSLLEGKEKPWNKAVRETYRFVPKRHDLKVGNRLVYRLKAVDNKRPDPNSAETVAYQIRITKPINEPRGQRAEDQEAGEEDRGDEDRRDEQQEDEDRDGQRDEEQRDEEDRGQRRDEQDRRGEEEDSDRQEPQDRNDAPDERDRRNQRQDEQRRDQQQDGRGEPRGDEQAGEQRDESDESDEQSQQGNDQSGEGDRGQSDRGESNDRGESGRRDEEGRRDESEKVQDDGEALEEILGHKRKQEGEQSQDGEQDNERQGERDGEQQQGEQQQKDSRGGEGRQEDEQQDSGQKDGEQKDGEQKQEGKQQDGNKRSERSSKDGDSGKGRDSAEQDDQDEDVGSERRDGGRSGGERSRSKDKNDDGNEQNADDQQKADGESGQDGDASQDGEAGQDGESGQQGKQGEGKQDGGKQDGRKQDGGKQGEGRRDDRTARRDGNKKSDDGQKSDGQKSGGQKSDGTEKSDGQKSGDQKSDGEKSGGQSKSGDSKRDQGKQGSGKQGSGKQDSGKQDSGKQDSGKQGEGKSGGRDGSGKDDQGQRDDRLAKGKGKDGDSDNAPAKPEGQDRGQSKSGDQAKDDVGKSDEQSADDSAISDRDSDAQGDDNSGDRKGDGQNKGGGQDSNQKGKGSAGQSESADKGASRSEQSGEGEGGSGQEKGSSQGKGQGNQDGEGQGDGAGKDQGKQSSGGEGDSKSSSDGNSGQGGGKQSSSEASDGKQAERDSEGGSGPGGGGQGGGGASSKRHEAVGDDPNLEYAQEQTDLALEYLEDQLKNRKVDQDLLDRLGWSEDELRQFVDRWQKMKRQAEQGDEEAKNDFSDALKSLGLRRPGSKVRTGTAKEQKARGLKRDNATEPPRSVRDQWEAFRRGLSRRGADE